MSNQQANNAGSSRSTNRVVGWCLAGVVGMFAFGFAMVPLYDVFCEITGINGKTGGRYESTEVAEADMTRTVKVQFLASNGPGMTWKFRPVVRSVEVHPGEPTTVNFYAENPTTEAMVGQAVPSLARRKARCTSTRPNASASTSNRLKRVKALKCRSFSSSTRTCPNTSPSLRFHTRCMTRASSRR